MIAILLMLIGTGALVEAAYGQVDFNDRRNRPRRHQDWQRGYNDGYDCHRIAIKVGEDFCKLNDESDRRRLGRQNYGRGGSACGRVRERLMDEREILATLSDIADRGYDESLRHADTRAVVQLEQDAKAALNCYSDRRDSFERDTQADSDRYHREQDERQRRESEQGEEGGNSEPRRPTDD